MYVRKLAWFLVCFFGFAAATVNAQSEARIRTVVPSIDEIENDLKWLIELSPDPSLRKQWKTLKEDVLDSFTQGIDLSKPVCVDVVFRKDGLDYELRLPISNKPGQGLVGKNGFLKGLEGIGYKVTAMNVGTYYKFSEKRDQAPFYLRYEKDYAWISKVALPGPQPDPLVDLKPLLGLEKDVVTNLTNDKDGLEARRENFKKLRQQFEALVKQRRNEDPNAFELRKLAAVQQLDEAERYVVEAQELLVTWNMSNSKPAATARGEISLTALPGTTLLKSIQEMAEKPSYFANVKLHEHPMAQGRMNFTLDAQRAAHIKSFYKSVRPILEGEIAKLPELNDAQKTATKQGANKFLDMLDSGLALGVVDLFADGFEAQPKQNVFICGVRSPDGTVADEIVKLLPQMDSNWKVKLAAQKYKDVTIHEITVPKEVTSAFQKLFASETVFYVATAKNSVWAAAGTDSIKYLQGAIDQTMQTAPEKADPVFISYQFQLDQLVSLMDLFHKAIPQKAASKDPKLEKERKQREKDIEKFHKLAVDSMSDCKALMHGELKKTGEKIEGHVEISECILKFIGSVVADGVKVLQ